MNILYLTASPQTVEMPSDGNSAPQEKEYPKLDLWPELAQITSTLFEARSNGFVNLEIVPEVKRSDVNLYLSNREVNLLHFSGHGDRVGPVGEDGEQEASLILSEDRYYGEYLPNEWLRDKLDGKNVDVVILNCCWSANVAKSLAGVVDLVIGTTCPVRSDTAAEFSAAFYTALQAGGTLREICDAAKKEVGDQQYAFFEHSPEIWDQVILPAEIPLDEAQQIVQTPAQKVLELRQRVVDARDYLAGNCLFDIGKVVVAFTLAFVVYLFIDGQESNNVDSNAGSPSIEQSGENRESDKKIKETNEEMSTWDKFKQFVAEANEKQGWLKWEPFALLGLLLGGSLGRLLAAPWLYLVAPSATTMLDVLSTQPKERIERELSSGYFDDMSKWLKEFYE